MSEYFKLPLDYIGITTFFNESHLGVDFGWNNDHGGPNVPIKSICDGIVYESDFNSSTGNRIIIESICDDCKFYHRYCHMANLSNYKKGDIVKKGDIIGNMGNTGDSTGNHLHLDLWKCPIDYIFNFDDRKKYSVNPLDYCFLFDDQIVNDSSFKYVRRVIGTFLNYDSNLNSLKVISKFLRIRDNYGLSSNILGFIDLGLFNYNDKVYKDGYVWYKIDDKYIAGTSDVIIYDNKSDLKNFVALKDDYYYIYLKKDDVIYY